MASRRSAQALGAESLYCCKDGWYVEDVDSGDELHLTSNALSLSAMRQAANFGRYGSWPRPASVPLPVQNLVRRLSATPGETEGSQEPWPRLSDYGADFGQFLEDFDSTCQTGDAPLHTVAARARLYALGKCLEDSLLDSYKGHLLRADKKGTLHHSPELVYSAITEKLKPKALGHRGRRRQRALAPVAAQDPTKDGRKYAVSWRLLGVARKEQTALSSMAPTQSDLREDKSSSVTNTRKL